MYKFTQRTFQKYVGGDVRKGTIELTVDWESLVKILGEKAAFNKSRKSGLGVGIKAKFIEDKIVEKTS